MNGEQLSPAGSRPRGSCTKQCHAITCNSDERHGCHDAACRSTYGLERCPHCGARLESLVTRINYEVWCLNESCDFHEDMTDGVILARGTVRVCSVPDCGLICAIGASQCPNHGGPRG